VPAKAPQSRSYAWNPAVPAAAALALLTSLSPLDGSLAAATSAQTAPATQASSRGSHIISIDRDKVEELIQQRLASRLRSLSDDEVADIMMKLLLGGDVPSGLLDVQAAPPVLDMPSPAASLPPSGSLPPAVPKRSPYEGMEPKVPLPGPRTIEPAAPDPITNSVSPAKPPIDEINRTPWELDGPPSSSAPGAPGKLSQLQSRFSSILQSLPDLKTEALQYRRLPQLPYVPGNMNTAIVVGVPLVALLLVTCSIVTLIDDVVTQRLPDLSNKLGPWNGEAPDSRGPAGQDGSQDQYPIGLSPPSPLSLLRSAPSSGPSPSTTTSNSGTAVNGAPGVLWERQDNDKPPSGTGDTNTAAGNQPRGKVLWQRDAPNPRTSPPQKQRMQSPLPTGRGRRRYTGAGKSASQGGPLQAVLGQTISGRSPPPPRRPAEHSSRAAVPLRRESVTDRRQKSTS